MASDIRLRTILIVREETRCRHIGYSFRLTARDLLYAPSHRQDNTYHGLCYTSRGALAGTRNSSIGPPHEGSIILECNILRGTQNDARTHTHTHTNFCSYNFQNNHEHDVQPCMCVLKIYIRTHRTFFFKDYT